MTVFLCILAAAALVGAGSYNPRSAPGNTLVLLQCLDIVLTLGLATLALVSYLS
jgi:hypothetical protein